MRDPAFDSDDFGGAAALLAEAYPGVGDLLGTVPLRFAGGPQADRQLLREKLITSGVEETHHLWSAPFGLSINPLGTLL